MSACIAVIGSTSTGKSAAARHPSHLLGQFGDVINVTSGSPSTASDATSHRTCDLEAKVFGDPDRVAS